MTTEKTNYDKDFWKLFLLMCCSVFDTSKESEKPKQEQNKDEHPHIYPDIEIALPTNPKLPAILKYRGHSCRVHPIYHDNILQFWGGCWNCPNWCTSGISFSGNSLEEAARQFKSVIDSYEAVARTKR